MTTEQFYQIAICASMIQDLADKGAELSNAEQISRENREFEHKNSRHNNADGFGIEVERYVNAKAKIEERIKAKNEELQKLIGNNESYWKTRCKLAEKIEEENPCDPDVTGGQIQAWNNYHNFIKDNGNLG